MLSMRMLRDVFFLWKYNFDSTIKWNLKIFRSKYEDFKKVRLKTRGSFRRRIISKFSVVFISFCRTHSLESYHAVVSRKKSNFARFFRLHFAEMKQTPRQGGIKNWLKGIKIHPPAAKIEKNKESILHSLDSGKNFIFYIACTKCATIKRRREQ